MSEYQHGDWCVQVIRPTDGPDERLSTFMHNHECHDERTIIRSEAVRDDEPVRLRERIEQMREAAMRQGTWGIEYGDDQFYRDVLAALPDEPVQEQGEGRPSCADCTCCWADELWGLCHACAGNLFTCSECKDVKRVEGNVREQGAGPQHGVAIRGDYGVTCSCGAVLSRPKGWSDTDESARRVVLMHQYGIPESGIFDLIRALEHPAQPAPDVAGLSLDEALMADLVRGPYLDSLMEDLRAGRTDAEHVARWLMGDLRALVAARSTSEDRT